MEEVGDNAKFCMKHNGEKRRYRCNECQDQQTYCCECYFQHLSTKHNKASPVRVSDEVEKRISRIEKYLEGDNEGMMRLSEFDRKAKEMKRELDELLKEERATTEKKKNEIIRMLWETETCDAEAIKCAGQLAMKVRASELGYDREKERVKAELQVIRSMKDDIEAEKASVRVENEVKAALWIKGDVIQGAIGKCEEATEKLKRAYRDLQTRVIMHEKDTVIMAKVVQTVSKFTNERLEECKNKIERRLKESEEAVIKSVSNVIKRYRDEREKFENVWKNPSGIVRQLEESSAARVKDLERLQRNNEWLKDNAMKASKEDLQKFQDMLREKIAEDERYADAPKMASSIYTHYYPYTGGKVVYLYNTVTKKTSTLTFDCDHPEKFSSTIIVENNLYIIGGDNPSSAVYSLAIAEGVAECKAIKKKELRVARGSLGLGQYAGKYIYALGGWSDIEKSVKCCEKYDIENDIWSALKDLKEGKQPPTACVIKEFIYAICGHTVKADLNSIVRMNIFKEDEGWQDFAIDNADKGWTARCGCGVCKINEDTVIVFGGCYAGNRKDECYLMKAVNNAAVISKLTNSLVEADSFSQQANCVIRNDELYSLSFNKDLYVCDLKSKTWKIEKNPCKC